MKVWCELGADGRPTSIWETDMSAAGLDAYELPDGVDALGLADYVWDGSAWSYDGAATAAREEAEREARREALRSSQLATAAAMYVRSTPMSRVDAVSVCSLYDEWSGDGVRYYGPDDPDGHPQTWLRYGDDFVRVEQTHTSQPDWTPEVAPSLYTLLPLAPDGIRIWEPPTHAENAFDIGERCHHPVADGEIWVSGRDGNVSEPGTDEWWKREGGTDGDPDAEEGAQSAEPYDPARRYASGEACLWEGAVYVWDADGRLGVPGLWSPGDYPQGWTREGGGAS